MSCIKETYMEYSIMTTNRCNLSCSYCINSKRREENRTQNADPGKIISHILDDSSKNHYEPVVITFYGGEPLMAQGLVEKIIEGTRSLRPMLNMFTNGTLINRENLALLNKMNMLSISIDGDEKTHDRFRGAGSFRKIMDNYASVRPELKAKALAFITVTREMELFRSVRDLAGKFDSVFWFMEHSPDAKNLAGFLESYSRAIELLGDWWLGNLKSGRTVNLIPFQGLYDIFEKKHVYSGFPCGIGENFQAIAIDGSIYSCEDSYHNKIGSTELGTDIKKAREHYKFEICDGCEVKDICAGRCVIPHLSYSKEKVEFYCKCTKVLINKFKSMLPEIKELVNKGVIKETQLLNKLTRFTDVIP